MESRKTARHVNIKSVAREAGVSTQTVSRVINKRPDVAPETRERVQGVIDRLGYRPNALARGLIARRSKTLGVITNSFDDAFFMKIISGAEAEARAHGYRFMLSSAAPDETAEQAYLRLLSERYVDGLLIVRHNDQRSGDALRALLDYGVPLATTATYLDDTPLTVVDVDNVDGGNRAVGYLCSQGHRIIAQITGPLGMRAAADRLRGYDQALAEHGLAPDPALSREGGWTYQSGFRAAQSLIESGRHFSAVFAHNDEMAIGALAALHAAGRNVPNDVSLVGYDDIAVSAYSIPALTTVRQPITDMGRLATRLLIQRIEGADVAPSTMLLQTELVVRDSVSLFKHRS